SICRYSEYATGLRIYCRRFPCAHLRSRNQRLVFVRYQAAERNLARPPHGNESEPVIGFAAWLTDPVDFSRATPEGQRKGFHRVDSNRPRLAYRCAVSEEQIRSRSLRAEFLESPAALVLSIRTDR